MVHKEKEAMINTFVYSNFNYGCLIWPFNSKKFQNRVKRIHERSLKVVSNEVFKTLNNLNIFHYSPNVTHKKDNLYIHTQNTTNFGSKSLRPFGPHIWNILPEYNK